MRDYDLDSEGFKFEAWVCETMSWIPERDLDRQVTHGDTSLGYEIKNDRLFRKYNRLFIETSESPSVGGRWHTASILQQATFLIQGDYNGVYVIPKKSVLLWIANEQYRRITKPRSKGVLVPVEYALWGSKYWPYSEEKGRFDP